MQILITKPKINQKENQKMKPNFTAIFSAASFFFTGSLILLDQYLNIGIWFQLKDIHHETLALSSFALAIGILLGSNCTKNSK
jgi:hypothetical protein